MAPTCARVHVDVLKVYVRIKVAVAFFTHGKPDFLQIIGGIGVREGRKEVVWEVRQLEGK